MTRPELLPDEFEISEVRIPPRFNIAPTQTAPVVRLDAEGCREAQLLRWGLVPHWSREPAPSARTINARSESLAEKPSFRSAFRARRCLVPADGFFEWTAADRVEPLQRWALGETPDPPRFHEPPAKGAKCPWYIRRRDAAPFAFAGLWERNERGAEPLETFTIVTCEASPFLRPFHERMPVILRREDYARWLDPASPLDLCQSLLVPYSSAELTCYPVDPAVNRPSFNDPRSVQPISVGRRQLFESGPE